MSIVTKTGDDGSTGLYGAPRVSKDSPRIHAYGSLDELNAVLGCALAEETLMTGLREECERTQQVLFRLGCDLATPRVSPADVPRIEAAHVEEVEQWIRVHEADLPAQRQFLLPDGGRAGTMLHLARTVCRRAERAVVALAATEEIGPDALKYINRLSDWLFLAARSQNLADGKQETAVTYE